MYKLLILIALFISVSANAQSPVSGLPALSSFPVFTTTPSGTTVAINLSRLSNYQTLLALKTGTQTLSISNPVSGGRYVIELQQPSATTGTVTWSNTIRWQGGTVPTLSTTYGAIDIIVLIYDGTTFLGSASLGY